MRWYLVVDFDGEFRRVRVRGLVEGQRNLLRFVDETLRGRFFGISAYEVTHDLHYLLFVVLVVDYVRNAGDVEKRRR